MTDCTIDTTIIGKSIQGDMECTEIISRITRCRMIICDIDQEILNEYNDCIQRGQQKKFPGYITIQKWICHLRNTNKIRYVCLNFSHADETGLTQLRFDRSDWVFVKACKESQSKELIAIESDYSPIIKEYLNQKHGIKVHHIDDCIGQNLYLKEI